jgi:hypothetical protein
MLRKLAPAFVVTTVALTAGCRSPSDNLPSRNPPEPLPPTPTPTPSASTAGTPSADTPAPVASAKETRKRKRTSDAGGGSAWTGTPATVDWSNITSIDLRDPNGRPIYASPDDHCYVETPPTTPPPTGGPTGMRYVQWAFLDCPPAMDDPAWDTCTSSGLSRSKTKDECYCMPLGGNPPPPPRVNRCPKTK